MIRRALAVAVGLVAVCFPVVAQQANRPEATQDQTVASEQMHAAGALGPAFALSLYRPKIFSAKDSLLFHKGPVRAWSEGGQLASETALAEIGMAPLDLFPVAYLPPPNAFGPAATKKGSAPSDWRSENFGRDGKDTPGEMMIPPPDRVYYGGEIGFMYGQWSGKGSGDMMESYILGQVGNDHFQITAGAAYEDWSGHTSRFHSFLAPR
ncbi:MAG: hypothetical protein DME71_09780 [Verrucomicrobia bacterium]|nr:MAG: hypothetical protein DME71_09780 [Verrucomicrobiota bacterium]